MKYFTILLTVLLLLSSITITSCNKTNNSMINPAMITKKVVVYDFWAQWCAPCRMFSPTFESWKMKYSNDNTSFIKINTDEDHETAQRFNISALPTVVITINGVEAKRWVGAPKEADLISFLVK